MALVKCPECGREISDTAKQCPHCGYTLKSNIETAKQVASVAGNALRNVFFKYGELVLPLLFLVTGMTCLFVGYDEWYYDFHFNEYCGLIVTSFQDFPFWLFLAGTIILPIVTYALCNSARKKAEGKGASIISQPKIVKKSGLLMFLIYLVGFSILSIIFYVDYADAKEKQQQYDPSKIVENNSTTTSSNSRVSDYGTYLFTMESGVDKENYKVVLNDDMTAQLIYESGTVVYGSWNRTSVGPNPEFIIRTPTLKNPYSKGRLSLYFRDGYVYFNYDQVRAKDPTNRTPYTKTN